MSPLWRDHVGISLSPQRVALVRRARGLQPRVTLKHSETIVPQQDQAAWRAALDKLGELLQQPQWQQADATVVLSNHLVQYACVPWHEKVSDADEQLALAQHRFMQIFGEVAQGWELRLSAEEEGAARLASAVEVGLLAALRAVTEQHGLKLHSIQPYAMAGFNHCAARIKQANVWFALAESGRLSLALLQAGKWSRFQTRRCEDLSVLKEWLDRENMLSDLPEPCREVVLFAPEAGPLTALTPYQVQRCELPACAGFSPITDTQYAMAMSGVL